MNPLSKNNIIETRYYINGYELYRKEINGVVDFERKTINISDDEKVFVRIEQKTGENPIVRYQYDNHLGSACLELDNTGQIISYEEYHPFGTTSYRSGRSQTEVSLKRYKYCGKERDEETGLYYYGMRYYAAWICRFVSVDPFQFKYPELTPFQYASNNPVSMIDLDGKEGIRISKDLKRNYPELYEAALTVIKSPQGKELFKDFVTKKQAKEYWGISETGKYVKNVDVVFTILEENQGGHVTTKINNQTYDVIKESGFKKSIDNKVKFKISIESALLGIVEGNKNPNALVENYAHETFLHSMYDLEILKNILLGKISNPEEEIIKALSGDNFDDESIRPGKLTTLFQHYLHYKGENDLYESFIKNYLEKLDGQNKIDFINEVNKGKEASEEEYIEYRRRINED